MENRYNPMSKEFQEEAKRLGLTGRQLAVKYQREEKFFEKGIYKDGRGNSRPYICYTEKELLNPLIQFYEENGKPPTVDDFLNNPGYPSPDTYKKRYGGFQKALKLVGLDFESMVKKGVIETDNQKGRFGEIIIRDHFKNYPIDLAGENCNSHCDGICPNGMTYDVKSSGLHKHTHKTYYVFGTNNKYKEDIEIYYFLAFNKDYTKLDYGWRVSSGMVEGSMFYIGTYHAKFNVDNMREYDITDRLRDVLKKYGFPKE